MIEIKTKEENMNMIRETLSRIGIVNKNTQTIYPSCYLVNKDDKFYIAHFKELLGNKNPELQVEDKARLYSICIILIRYGFITIDGMTNDRGQISFPNEIKETCFVSIVPYTDKHNYKIIHKINIRKIN